MGRRRALPGFLVWQTSPETYLSFDRISARSRPCLSIIADLKLQLSSTDYGNFLQNEPSPLSTSTIADKCLEHLVNEFDYVRAYSVQPLTKFCDYIT